MRPNLVALVALLAVSSLANAATHEELGESTPAFRVSWAELMLQAVRFRESGIWGEVADAVINQALDHARRELTASDEPFTISELANAIVDQLEPYRDPHYSRRAACNFTLDLITAVTVPKFPGSCSSSDLRL